LNNETLLFPNCVLIITAINIPAAITNLDLVFIIFFLFIIWKTCKHDCGASII
jgi:hypothetical protein